MTVLHFIDSIYEPRPRELIRDCVVESLQDVFCQSPRIEPKRSESSHLGQERYESWKPDECSPVRVSPCDEGRMSLGDTKKPIDRCKSRAF